jgi:hypothetical protein
LKNENDKKSLGNLDLAQLNGNDSRVKGKSRWSIKQRDGEGIPVFFWRIYPNHSGLPISGPISFERGQLDVVFGLPRGSHV